MVPSTDGSRIACSAASTIITRASATGDYGFEVDGARITYGRGVLAELGEAAKALQHEARGGVRRSAFARARLRADRARLAARREDRRRRLHRHRGRADRCFVQAGRGVCGRRQIRRLRFDRRRLDDGYRQSGRLVRHLSGRLHGLRQRADRRRPADSRPAHAAHRLPDDLRNRQRMHRHRDLRLPRDEREDGHSRARTAARRSASSIPT